MNLKNISLFTSLLLLAACQKKDDTGFHAEQLKINIEKPLSGQSFGKGDTVFIKATATYTTELHGYELSLLQSDSSEIWSLDEHLHGSNFAIDTFWVNDRDTDETLRLQLTVEADHDGHQKSENRTFKTLKK